MYFEAVNPVVAFLGVAAVVAVAVVVSLIDYKVKQLRKAAK